MPSHVTHLLARTLQTVVGAEGRRGARRRLAGVNHGSGNVRASLADYLDLL